MGASSPRGEEAGGPWASTARLGVIRTNRRSPRTIRGHLRLFRGFPGPIGAFPGRFGGVYGLFGDVYGLPVDGKERLGGFNGRFGGVSGPIGGFPGRSGGVPPTNRGRALPLGSGSLRTVISDGPITTGSRRLDSQDGNPRFSTPGKSAETWNDRTRARNERYLTHIPASLE